MARDTSSISFPGKLTLLAALYIAQGLPFGYFTQTLPAVMRKQGYKLSTISFTALLTLPWALKFLWAPLVDRYPAPTPTVRARRKRWILGCQLARVEAAAARLEVPLELEVRVRSVDGAAMPGEADVVIALHACGPATDAILDGAAAARARWILCAPCCYGDAIPGYAAALEEAASLGLDGDATLRARFAAVRVDGARLERLRAAGYEAGLRAFTAPTVTPHHLLFRARRGGR